MITAQSVTKCFDDIKAIDNVTAQIKTGLVFGLIGSNGAGKSTFLRMMAGILKPDKGELTIDGAAVFENPAVKERFFYISDEQYYFSNATPAELKAYYRQVYTRFDAGRFDLLMKNFGLSADRKINTFSKGMKKQLSVISAVSAMTEYIFCDETFDGLDPVARQAVKSIFAADLLSRGMTPVIASHNLRELEDICDHVGLLHRGGILLSRDLEDMKLNIHKVQCAFSVPVSRQELGMPDILSFDQRGSLVTMILRGELPGVLDSIKLHEPVFLETLPLSLEEIFINETEAVGYDLKKLLF